MGEHRITRDAVTPMLRGQLLAKEYEALAEAPPAGMYVFPASLTEWSGAVFVRQRDNPYAGGVYKFMLYFPEAYPFERPTCRFVTTMYHPSVDPVTGEADIGMDWFSRLVPFQDCIVVRFLTEIKRLFLDPTKADHPRNVEANSALGSPIYEEKARVCAKRAAYTASHPTPGFPHAIKFQDIPEAAVLQLHDLLEEREMQNEIDVGEEEEGGGRGGGEGGGDDSAPSTANSVRRLRVARPSIITWFRNNFMQISRSMAGSG